MVETIVYELEDLANAANVFTFACGIPGNHPSHKYPGMINYSSDGCPIITGKQTEFNYYQIGQMFGHSPKNWQSKSFSFSYLKRVTLAYLNKNTNWQDMLDYPPFEFIKQLPAENK